MSNKLKNNLKAIELTENDLNNVIGGVSNPPNDRLTAAFRAQQAATRQAALLGDQDRGQGLRPSKKKDPINNATLL